MSERTDLTQNIVLPWFLTLTMRRIFRTSTD